MSTLPKKITVDFVEKRLTIDGEVFPFAIGSDGPTVSFKAGESADLPVVTIGLLAESVEMVFEDSTSTVP